MPDRILHPCEYAKGNYGSCPYICIKKNNQNCINQFYCQEEKYWRPTYKIKCSDFKEKTKEPSLEKKDEQKQNEQ